MHIKSDRYTVQIKHPGPQDIKSFTKSRYKLDPYDADLTFNITVDGEPFEAHVFAVGYEDCILSWVDNDLERTYYTCVQLYNGPQPSVRCYSSDDQPHVFELAMLAYARQYWREDSIEIHVIQHILTPAV